MLFENLIRNIGRLNDENPDLCAKLRAYVYDIVGCCQEVHREMGPFLNEYIYQEALNICFEEHGICGDEKLKEYYFSTEYHGHKIQHPHRVDFFIRNKVYVECKAIASIGPEQRQQLWNYMRLTKVRVGILYNFAPIKDQSERYYLDVDKQMLYAF